MDGAEITRRRKAVGLSRAELARAVGVDQSTVWRWETTTTSKPIGIARAQLESVFRRLERRRTSGPEQGE